MKNSFHSNFSFLYLLFEEFAGDIVAVIPESEVNEETQSKKTFHFSETGVVYRVGQNKLQIALKKRTTTMSDESLNILQDNKTARFTLTLLTNDVTYKRMEAALLRLQHNDVGPATRVLNVLFGISTPSHGPLQESFVPFNVTLNQSQRDAVIFALSSQGVNLLSFHCLYSLLFFSYSFPCLSLSLSRFRCCVDPWTSRDREDNYCDRSD